MRPVHAFRIGLQVTNYCNSSCHYVPLLHYWFNTDGPELFLKTSCET